MKKLQNEIMIVSDNSWNNGLLNEFFNGREFAFIFEDSENFTFNLVEQVQPDCLVFDIEMPDSKGLHKMCKLTENYNFTDIPVIVICMADEKQNIGASLNYGGVSYITRPFQLGEITSAIEKNILLRNINRNIDSLVQIRAEELVKTTASLQEEVEDYRHALHTLQENETLLLTIAMNFPNSYLAIVDRDYSVAFASGQEFRRLGIDSWSMVGLNVADILPHKAELIIQNLNRALQGNEVTFEVVVKKQFHLYKLVPIKNSKEEVVRVLAVIENITDRKFAERKTMDSLKEKEILLKEIHHRVKNNMQLMTGMLNLQSEYITNDDAKSLFESFQNRIYSMSLVHEKLYHYDNLSFINMKEYIFDLVEDIKNSYMDQEYADLIEIVLNVGDEILSIDMAVPCGLIINELVINAFKYGFANGGGTLRISFFRDVKGQYELSVNNNGTIMSDGVDIHKNRSMGLMLVRALTEQLHGTLLFKNNPETQFTIQFGNRKIKHVRQLPSLDVKDNDLAGTILIVEDEKIISAMLCNILEKAGYRVVDCVSSGEEAIVSAYFTDPDLVLMDIVLDDKIDGVEAARTITQNCGCPVVFLSGNSDPATMKAAGEINPHGMLTKPVNRTQLLQVLHSVLH